MDSLYYSRSGIDDITGDSVTENTLSRQSHIYISQPNSSPCSEPLREDDHYLPQIAPAHRKESRLSISQESEFGDALDFETESEDSQSLYSLSSEENDEDSRHKQCVARWRAIAGKALAQRRYDIAVAAVRKCYPTGIDWKPTMKFESKQIPLGKFRLHGKKLSDLALRRRSTVHPTVHRFFFRISSWKKFLIPLGYAILTFAYAFAGGGIYYFLENQAEIDLVHSLRKERNAIVDVTAARLANSLNHSHNCALSDSSVEFLKEFLIKYHIETGLYPSSTIHWTFLGSSWFALTIFTTIGYGNFAPNTVIGRLFTIVYALCGIPLLLLTLNEIGKLFTWLLKKIYNKIIKCWNRTKKQVLFSKSKLRPYRSNGESHTQAENGHLRSESEPEEAPTQGDILSTYSKSKCREFDFPIPIAIGLIIIWILTVSYLTTWCEDFDLITSIYFWFITFTTIGLGDYTPKHASTGFMFLPILFVGLALISMVITLLQSKIEEFEDVVLEDYLGWETESACSSDDDNEDFDYIRVDGETVKLRPNSSHASIQRGRSSQPAGESGGFTLGVFQAGPYDRGLSSSRSSLAKKTLNIWNQRPYSIAGFNTQNSNRSLGQRKLPANVARVLELQKASRRVHRIRRGIQTDDSFLFESRMGEGRSWKQYRRAAGPACKLDNAVSHDGSCG